MKKVLQHLILHRDSRPVNPSHLLCFRWKKHLALCNHFQHGIQHIPLTSWHPTIKRGLNLLSFLPLGRNILSFLKIDQIYSCDPMCSKHQWNNFSRTISTIIHCPERFNSFLYMLTITRSHVVLTIFTQQNPNSWAQPFSPFVLLLPGVFRV